MRRGSAGALGAAWTASVAALGMWACVRPAVEGPKRSPNVITAEEIPGAQARNAYEIVERLRPRWLRVPLDRSARLETVILAYVDDAKLGSVDELRAVPVEGIVSIRYLDAAQAGSLPGAGSLHVAGAVVVSTRRAP